MLTTEFYKLLNDELLQLIRDNPNNELLNHHKDIEQNKGYAFLVWFLEFYGQTPSYKQYITDGTDDSSCDIIFSNIDSQSEKRFYVIQSKWRNIKINKKQQLVTSKSKPIQEFPQIAKEEFNSSMKEFDTVLDGTRKEGINERFNKKYRELIEHLENNGKAKFIFFTASKYNPSIQDTIDSFIKQHSPNVAFELIDIDKIKRDYIEFKFKEIVSTNPLEYSYDPEDSVIKLDIARFKSGESIEQNYQAKRDMLQFEGRTQAFIFLLKPKMIYELFKKYKFSLFFKNVRNPLHRSNYNEQIVETLQKRPDTFWYFNNGITAITKLIPDVGDITKNVTVKGLQIINGAQTVYSIYKAYEEATTDQREVMDTDARISFRLIRSSDEQFNLEITRFTNQQNQMEDRDFVANLDEQRRLQIESFDTNYWYEKRRGEFRDKELLEEKGIRIVPNEFFIQAYMAFYLQRPVDAIHEDNFFIKRTDNAKGLYEDIFNAETKFEDMLCSHYIAVMTIRMFGEDSKDGIQVNEFFIDFSMPVVALARVVLKKYLNSKGGQSINSYILKHLKDEENKDDNLKKVLQYSINLMFSKINLKEKDKEKSTEIIHKMLTSPVFYEKVKEEVEATTISKEDIESIDLEAKSEELDDIMDGMKEEE